MTRILAVIAAVVAVILFVACAVFHPANPFAVEAWGFASLASAVGLLALG